MNFILVIVIGYLFGCVHGSQIIGKYKKINIKKSGMENSGATNATLLLGWRYGILVAIVDIGKSVVSMFLVTYLLNMQHMIFDLQLYYLLLNALFVIIGHNYPMTMNFNGGKGTASFFGVLLYLDWKYAMISLFMALIFAFITNYFVFGTMLAYLAFITYIAYVYGKGPVLLAFFFTILFLAKHMENFKRILNQEEVKLSTLFRKEIG